LNNLKQLGTAINFYLDANEEYFPGCVGVTEHMLWSYALNHDYSVGDDVFKCPSDVVAYPHKNGRSYGVNYFVIPDMRDTSTLRSVKLPELRDPSGSAVFAEGWQGTNWSTSPSSDNGSCSNITRTQLYGTGAAKQITNGTNGVAHNGGANHTFADGHSEHVSNDVLKGDKGKKMWENIAK
jgi:prepilin-type processing-associated H-X9-DG protein